MLKVAPWTKLNIVFKPVLRLKALSKLKSAAQTLNQSNVVYRINCTDCNNFYIGLTTRRLHKRLQEHKKGNIVQCINIQKQAIVLIGTILKLLDMIM